ncbi:FUSC family protein [Halosquirtibacter xylanolyticus]|uniref:FUSC family protein n=1 Tax=Halosquirtibacter xylanolyticus TaxID=3374599 RepID=UPI00374A29D7|nr:FUSC family protein [Prolixibacteraceae bacterium]
MTHQLRLSIIFGTIILIYLFLTETFEIRHSEWGLMTIVVIFSPSKGLSVSKAIRRIFATLLGALSLIIFSYITESRWYYLLCCLSIAIAGVLCIKDSRNSYLYFVYIATIGVFGVGVKNIGFNLEFISILMYRILIVASVSIITALIITTYDHIFKPNFEQPNIQNHSDNKVIIYLFRVIICYILFTAWIKTSPESMHAGAGVILTILLGITATKSQILPTIKAVLVSLIISIIIIFLWKYLLIETTPNTIQYILIAIIYSCIMYVSMGNKKLRSILQLTLVMFPLMYNITPNSMSSISPFIKILLIMLNDIMIFLIGCYLATKIDLMLLKMIRIKPQS